MCPLPLPLARVHVHYHTRTSEAISFAGRTPHGNGRSRKRALRTITGTGVEEYDALDGTTLLRRTLGLLNLHRTRYIGPNDAIDAYGWPQIEDRIAHNTRRATCRVRYVHPRHAFQLIADADTPGFQEDAATTDEIERTVEGNGVELVKVYFRVVHPSFPILHKDVFLEKYGRSYKEFSPPLLAAVYLLAWEYWKYIDTLSNRQKPNLARLRTLAMASFQSAVRRPKLSNGTSWLAAFTI